VRQTVAFSAAPVGRRRVLYRVYFCRASS